jgi:hypothetical protein
MSNPLKHLRNIMCRSIFLAFPSALFLRLFACFSTHIFNPEGIRYCFVSRAFKAFAQTAILLVG